MIDPSWDLEELVTVGTFAASWEARLAQARLAAEGVDAVVTDEIVGTFYGGSVVGGIKLRVREDEAARASEVLARESPIPEIYLVTEEDARQPRCPSCRSENISSEGWLVRRWTCRRCGAAWKEGAIPEGEEDPDLITVARFGTPWEAHLARTLLESHGIDACVMEERFPPIDLLSGQPLALNRLAVHPADADRALEALAAVETSEEGEVSANES
jgi:Putative prokaryotic signal transducing protein